MEKVDLRLDQEGGGTQDKFLPCAADRENAKLGPFSDSTSVSVTDRREGGWWRTQVQYKK